MTIKADYTAEEWELITRVPIMVALAVVLAGPSGPVGVVKEMFAVGSVLEEWSGEGSTADDASG